MTMNTLGLLSLDRFAEQLRFDFRGVDRAQPQPVIHLLAQRVEDHAADAADVEYVKGDLGSQRVAIVAAGGRHEGVRALSARLAQGVLVGAVAQDALALEGGGQVVEGILVDVEDGDLVAIVFQHCGKLGAETAAAHDDHEHDYSAGIRSRMTSHGAVRSTCEGTLLSSKSPYWRR